MTTDEVKALYKQNLLAYYSPKNAPADKDAVKYQIGIWSTALANVPAPAAQAALLRAFTVCRFPVTLADLCSQLHSMQEESDPPAGQLWAQITEAAYRARENKSLYSYTGRAADGRSIRQVAQEANKQIFEGLPVACRAWIGTLQALIDLDGDDATGKNFRRRDFEKFYREYQAARPLDPERLAALPCVNGNPELESTARPQVEA